MNILFAILFFSTLCLYGDESYFFRYEKKWEEVEKSINGKHLLFTMPIQKVDPPKAISIYAFPRNFGVEKKYKIQIEIKEPPVGNELLKLKLGDDLITKGIVLFVPKKEKGGSASIHIESGNLEQTQKWCKLLGSLLKISEDAIEIDLGNPSERAD